MQNNFSKFCQLFQTANTIFVSLDIFTVIDLNVQSFIQVSILNFSQCEKERSFPVQTYSKHVYYPDGDNLFHKR